MSYNHSISIYIPQTERKKSTLCSCQPFMKPAGHIAREIWTYFRLGASCPRAAPSISQGSCQAPLFHPQPNSSIIHRQPCSQPTENQKSKDGKSYHLSLTIMFIDIWSHPYQPPVVQKKKKEPSWILEPPPPPLCVREGICSSISLDFLLSTSHLLKTPLFPNNHYLLFNLAGPLSYPISLLPFPVTCL